MIPIRNDNYHNHSNSNSRRLSCSGRVIAALSEMPIWTSFNAT